MLETWQKYVFRGPGPHKTLPWSITEKSFFLTFLAFAADPKNVQKWPMAPHGQVHAFVRCTPCTGHSCMSWVIGATHGRAPTHLPFIHTCLSLVHGIFLFVVILEECAWVQHPLGKRPEPFVQVGEGHALVAKDLLEVRDRCARTVFFLQKNRSN